MLEPKTRGSPVTTLYANGWRARDAAVLVPRWSACQAPNDVNWGLSARWGRLGEPAQTLIAWVARGLLQSETGLDPGHWLGGRWLARTWRRERAEDPTSVRRRLCQPDLSCPRACLSTKITASLVCELVCVYRLSLARVDNEWAGAGVIASEEAARTGEVGSDDQVRADHPHKSRGFAKSERR